MEWTWRRWVWVGGLLSLLAACSRDPGTPSGECGVTVEATLIYATDAGSVGVRFDEVDGGRVALGVGQPANLMYFVTSARDFQYQAHVADTDNNLVVETLVPTTHVDVPSNDPSVYIYDVVPVDTTALSGLYELNVGVHINVNPDEFACTGPIGSDGALAVSTWKTLGLRVGGPPPPTSSSSRPAASSAAGTSSSGGTGGSSSGGSSAAPASSAGLGASSG